MTAPSAPHTQLRGSWLPAARAIWIALVILALATWAASLGPRFNELSIPCAGDECPLLTLSPQEADALRGLGFSLEIYAGYQVGWEIFSVIVDTLLAAIIFRRRSNDRMGLFISLMLILMGTVLFSGGYYALWIAYPRLSLLFDLLTILAVVGLLSVFYLFPHGRFVPGWTGFLAALFGAYILGGSLLSGGFNALFFTPGWLRSSAYILLFGCLGVGLLAQVYGYSRVSTPPQRQQTKWVVFGLAAMAVGTFVWGFGVELFPPAPGVARLYVNLGGVTLIFLAILFFPLTLAIAILRYRLWDIDVIVRRTLIYGVLTGALALVYFGSVVLLQYLFAAVGGQRSELAIVASTLAIAALFNPLRGRIQSAIDRRFYRRKYDAAKTLAAFGATIRDEVDLNRLTERLVAVVEETMQPERASLWLRKR